MPPGFLNTLNRDILELLAYLIKSPRSYSKLPTSASLKKRKVMVHLLRRSRSQHRANAPAPIAAPRCQGGLRWTYQPRLAHRKLFSSARVVVPDVLRALLRAHRLLAAEIFRVRSGSGALQPTFRPRELNERRARPRRAAFMYAMAGGAGSSCRS